MKKYVLYAILLVYPGFFYGIQCNKHSKSTSTTKLRVGDTVPNFTLLNEYGESVTLSTLLGHGKSVVLCFVPSKYHNLSSSTQLNALRANYQQFKDNDIIVLGIKNRSVQINYEIRREKLYQFDVLSDADKKIAKLYGVMLPWYIDLFCYGPRYPRRFTFFIDPEGTIVKIIPPLNMYEKNAEKKYIQAILQ